MPRNHPKDPGNKYAFYRDKAGISSQEAVAEKLGISAKAYQKYETGESTPDPTRIDDMATIFKAPELRNWYCREICALGRYNVEEVNLEGSSLDMAAVKLFISIEATWQVKGLLLKIVADGKIVDEEQEDLKKLFDELEQVEVFAHEFRLWLEKSKDAFSKEMRQWMEDDIFIK